MRLASFTACSTFWPACHSRRLLRAPVHTPVAERYWEWARHTIRCAAIAPGSTATELLASMNQAVLDVIPGKIPIGGLVEADEIAQSMLQVFDNDTMTGNIFEVGGVLALIVIIALPLSDAEYL